VRLRFGYLRDFSDGFRAKFAESPFRNYPKRGASNAPSPDMAAKRGHEGPTSTDSASCKAMLQGTLSLFGQFLHALW
jgi:hypothetical protein